MSPQRAVRVLEQVLIVQGAYSAGQMQAVPWALLTAAWFVLLSERVLLPEWHWSVQCLRAHGLLPHLIQLKILSFPSVIQIQSSF